MTTIKDEYIFTSRVKSLGEQQNSQGWRLELEWKLPGSKFPLSLYGQDWDDVGGPSKWGAGSTPEIHIAKGNLKNDKDGRYSSDYFWDLMYIREPDGSYDLLDNQPPAPQGPTASPEPRRGALSRPDDVQTRIDIGMAFNAAYTLLAAQGYTVTGSIEMLRYFRDKIYHEVIQKGIAPEGYCYVHEENCRQGKTGKWGHQMEDGVWCVDGVAQSAQEQDSPLVQTAMSMGATPITDDDLEFVGQERPLEGTYQRDTQVGEGLPY